MYVRTIFIMYSALKWRYRYVYIVYSTPKQWRYMTCMYSKGIKRTCNMNVTSLRVYSRRKQPKLKLVTQCNKACFNCQPIDNG